MADGGAPRRETMTGRQRVERAIRHQETDRCPIDLGVHFSTGISAAAYHNLREYLGLDTGAIEMIDCVQGLARVDEDILDRFHIDTVLLNPPWEHFHTWNMRDGYRFRVPDTFQPVRQPDGGWRADCGGESMYMPAGGYFFDGAWPDFYGLGEEEKLLLFARRAERLYKETDRFTLMMGFSAYFSGLDFACDMLTDPEECHRANEAELQKNLRLFDRVNALFGRYIGAIEVNSDLGMQSAAMCSPESYEAVVYPYLRRFCAHVHESSDIKVFLHSCGSVYVLLPLLVDAGIDILNPVQVSAAGMDPRRLKEEFGDRLCFWGGGCDTQQVLPAGTPGEVAANVGELAAILGENGGFVFNQVHNIMGNIPPENIVALYETAYRHAWRHTLPKPAARPGV